MDLNESLVLKNLTDDDLHFQYDGQKTKVRAHNENLVSFQVVQTYFGDPRSGPSPYRFTKGGRANFIESRENELRRLGVLYGCYEDSNELLARVPKVEIYTLEGTRVLTPIHDPDGMTIMSTEQDADNINDVTTLIRRHEEALSTLKERMDSLSRSEVQANTEEELATDEPIMPGRTSRRTR